MTSLKIIEEPLIHLFCVMEKKYHWMNVKKVWKKKVSIKADAHFRHFLCKREILFLNFPQNYRTQLYLYLICFFYSTTITDWFYLIKSISITNELQLISNLLQCPSIIPVWFISMDIIDCVFIFFKWKYKIMNKNSSLCFTV